jgi:transposase
MSLIHPQHIQTLPSQINSLIPTIKHLSAAQRDNNSSLTFLDLSCQNIASQTGIGKSTVARDLQEIQPDKENHHGGHSSKLSPTHKYAIVQRILTGKTSNAVQATYFIIAIISTPVCSQTVRNTLKEVSLKAVVKKKKLLLHFS